MKKQKTTLKLGRFGITGELRSLDEMKRRGMRGYPIDFAALGEERAEDRGSLSRVSLRRVFGP